MYSRRQHRLNDEQLCLRRHNPATVFQEFDAPLVIPIVNDMLQYICVATVWDGLCDITSDNLATFCQAGCFDFLLSPLCDMWQIEDDTTHSRVGSQEGGHEYPIRSANIY